MRLLHDGAHLPEGELAAEDIGVRRQDPTTGHDLHDTGAAVHPLADGRAQRVRTRRAPPIDAQWPPGTVSGGPDATTVGPSPPPRPVDDRPSVVPEIAHGRHACPEVLLLGGRDDVLEPLGGQLGELVQRPGAAVAAEVDMGVDQPGQERRAGR